jgi:PAS domain S-box-containing protein
MDKQSSTASADAVTIPSRRAAPLSLTEDTIQATIVAGLLDAAPDGLLLVDGHGHVVMANTRIEEMFGYPREELLGHPVEVLLPEAVREVHVAHRQRFVDQPKTRPMGAGLSLSGRRRDGSEFPVEISLSPLAADDSRWTVAGIRDATDRVALERQRRDDAVLDEQSRIAEDLADTVIHGLFGTGLQLQGLLEAANERVRPGLESAIDNIDQTIRAIRTAVFGLRTHDGGRGGGTSGVHR